MPTNPNPTKLVRLVHPEMVMRHRSLFCTCYDECLEHAADLAWPSWSCEHCPLYVRRHEMTAQYARANYHPAYEAEYVLAV